MPKRLVSPTGKRKVLPAVRPNQGIEAAYRKSLESLIDEMHRSLIYWISAAYRARPPMMAQDAPDGGGRYDGMSPATVMRETMRRLGRRWERRFADLAPRIAQHFSASVKDRADGALMTMLKDAGFTVKFHLTAEANDVLQATIGEQVGLIKSIASEHLSEVEGLVMRSVSSGRDLGSLAKSLEERYGVTRRRAALISRDQNNKATANITRVRREELGLFEAIWLHSGAGKHPRPSHVSANGKTFDIRKGMLIDGEYIQPGELINCRCCSRPVIPSP